MPLIEVISSVALALIIWYGGSQVLRNYMTLRSSHGFHLLHAALLPAHSGVFAKIHDRPVCDGLGGKDFSASRRKRLYAAGKRSCKHVHGISGHIEFRNVVFSYEAGRPVLRNISFEVKPGNTLAIIGATGSGKTTIINLLERFYDPQHGSILLDGVDLRRFEPHWLREHIGLVMQDIFIVPGSIRENILLDRELPESEIVRILQLSQLEKLVQSLPLGLDTNIGEGGMDLSAVRNNCWRLHESLPVTRRF